MSEHLPECPTAWMRDCICTELRLCEQRIREEWYEAQSEAWEQGFHHALDAAREAVARQCGHTKSVSTNYECDHDRAIAAINDLQDALQDDLSRYE